jgi:hypothetical protein
MIRMLIVGYCFGIRSGNSSARKCISTCAYHWFCQLGLDGDVAHHSSFSKNRHGRRERHCGRCSDGRPALHGGRTGWRNEFRRRRLIKADANKQRSAEGSEDVDWEAMALTRRSVREYLDTLDEAAWGAASETRPKFISRSDPAAQWTGALKGHAFFAYATNYLISTTIIVDAGDPRDQAGKVGAAAR